MNFQKMPAKKVFCSQLLSQSSVDYPPPISSLPSLPATSHGFLIFHVSVFLPSTILHLFGPETGSTPLFPSFSLCISVFSLKWSHFDPFCAIFFITSIVKVEKFSVA